LRQLASPAILNYALGIAAVCVRLLCRTQGRLARRDVLLLLLCYYPITMSKLVLFAPVWLVTMFVLSKLLEVRASFVVALLTPAASGIVLFVLYKNDLAPYKFTISYFGLVNFRIIAIPSLAMDYYNEFFSRHFLTQFCQISFSQTPHDAPIPRPALGRDLQRLRDRRKFQCIAVCGGGYHLRRPDVCSGCGFRRQAYHSLGKPLVRRFAATVHPDLQRCSCASSGRCPIHKALLTHGAVLLFLFWYIAPLAVSDAR
jgi:hypothetical protein